MTSVSLHAPPRWPAIVAEQVRSAGVMLRAGGMMLVAAFVTLIATGIYSAMDIRSFNIMHAPYTVSMTLVYESGMALITTVIAALLPFLLWQDEGPAHRSYHWAMPVSRHGHSFAKVVAGWLWMMGVTLAYLASIAAASVIVEKISGIPQRHTPHFALWEWAIPFGSATVVYLFASALAVGVKRPLLWVAGVAIAYGYLLVALNELALTKAELTVRAVMSGHVGLMRIIEGDFRWVDTEAEKLFMLPHMGAWAGATVLWGTVASALLAIALYRHTEPT